MNDLDLAVGGLRAFAAWCRATIRPAGALVLAAATAGLAAGVVFGWVEALVAGAAALVLLLLSIPFLFHARAYDVGLALGRERVVAGSPAVATVTVRNTGTRIALPGRTLDATVLTILTANAAFVILGAALIVGIAVTLSLRPLYRLGDAIAERSPDDLHPIEQSVPSEVEAHARRATLAARPSTLLGTNGPRGREQI